MSMYWLILCNEALTGSRLSEPILRNAEREAEVFDMLAGADLSA